MKTGDLVGAIANEARINSKILGGIEVLDRFSLVEVPESMASKSIEGRGRGRRKGKKRKGKKEKKKNKKNEGRIADPGELTALC